MDELNRRVGAPPIPETGETLEQSALRKDALPVRPQSPLLGYELPVLRQIEPCELRRRQAWTDMHHQLLAGVMARPQYKPSFGLEDYPDNCSGITDSGRHIQCIVLYHPSDWKPLGADARASYEQRLRGSVRYWLPMEYLP